jgi:1,4-alpha-glucan branching enzyme
MAPNMTNVAIAPSPLADRMGAALLTGACSFRVFAPFAATVSLRYWAGGAPHDVAMARDSADGYGGNCWSVEVPGLTAGTQYRFLVTPPAGGPALERVDAFGRSVIFPNWTPAGRDDSDARSVVIADPGAITVGGGGWRDQVIYQLHVGTFVDATAGATSPLAGLRGQVPYLAGLGVGAVQFLPFTEFASLLSLGYNSALPFAIEHDYGTPNDLRALFSDLHGRGVRVLIDVVYNHIDVQAGSGVLPYSLFQYDGWGGNPAGVFFYGGDEINTPWGAPRPDYGRAEVRRYLRDNALMWIAEYGVDGLRFDSTKCIRRRQGPCGDQCCGSDIGVQRNFGWELMQEINDAIDGSSAQLLTVAEDLDGNTAITAPVARGGAGFDAQWDPELRDAVRAAITQARDGDVDLGRVASALERPDPFSRVIYLESHDEAKDRRIIDRIAPGDAQGRLARKKSLLGYGVVLTAAGLPMIFQGCELLDWRRWNDAVSMPWANAGLFPRYRQFFSDAIRLRRNAGGRTGGLTGAFTHVVQANPGTKVLAYHRWDRGSGADDVMVVANFSGDAFASYTIGFPYPGTWYVRLNSDANVYSDSNDFGSLDAYDTTAGPIPWDGMPFSGNVGLPPFSLLILSR